MWRNWIEKASRPHPAREPPLASVPVATVTGGPSRPPRPGRIREGCLGPLRFGPDPEPGEPVAAVDRIRVRAGPGWPNGDQFQPSHQPVDTPACGDSLTSAGPVFCSILPSECHVDRVAAEQDDFHAPGVFQPQADPAGNAMCCQRPQRCLPIGKRLGQAEGGGQRAQRRQFQGQRGFIVRPHRMLQIRSMPDRQQQLGARCLPQGGLIARIVGGKQAARTSLRPARAPVYSVPR